MLGDDLREHQAEASCAFELSKAARARLKLSMNCPFESFSDSHMDHNPAFLRKDPVQGLYYNSLSSPPNITGYAVVQQTQINKLMHILNGNTTLRLHWSDQDLHANMQLQLTALLEITASIVHPKVECSKSTPNLKEPHTPKESDFFMNKLKLSRDFLLSQRTVSNNFENNTKITTQFLGSAHSAHHSSCKSRTGRRIQNRSKEGERIFHKRPKARRDWVSRIRGITTLCRTPPPVGAPGSHFGTDKECTPQQDTAKVLSRGTYRRRLRSRAYRKWFREHKQACGKGVGSPNTAVSLPKNAAQSRALWFRKSLLWQQHHTRRRKVRVTNYPTTTPLGYEYKFRLGTLNVQGFADTLKLKNCLQLMREHNLDVLFLTETKSHSYYTYISEQHMVILSGNHFDKNAGVGAIIHPKIRPYLLDIIQVSPRILQVSFKKQGGNVHMIGAYAPHAGLDLEELREPFWDTLEQHLSKIPQPEPIYLTGDFNVRFQARHKHDHGVTGPFTYGKGSRYIDHNASSNRSLCVKTMMLQNMVEVASYRTPNPMHHITFRDKAAPPKDWSQFVLDPLILQQVYGKMHTEFGDEALAIAALLRSYLTLPEPLDAPKILPQPDPVRFQRLDHCFTRRQWLNTVCSCRSKLYTGFPSDHYLLVTEVKIKLLARRPQPPKRVRFDFKNVTADQKTLFNEAFRKELGDTQTTTHALPIIPREGTFFTDGSGSSGKCTRRTPAGWGWCAREGDTGKMPMAP